MIHSRKNYNYTHALNMPISLCEEDEGFDPANEPVFYAVPASKLKKISAGSGPASKTKSPHRLTEPHTNNFHVSCYTDISFIYHT